MRSFIRVPSGLYVPPGALPQTAALGVGALALTGYAPTIAVAGAGGSTLFTETFSTANFSHEENGISWIGTSWVDCVSTPSALAGAGIGTHVGRFRQGESTNWGELKFDGLPNLTEVYLDYDLYWPDGTESPSAGPKVQINGTANDKFIRLWGNNDADYDALPGCKVGASTFGSGGGPSDGAIGIEYMLHKDGEAQWNMGQGDPATSRQPLINDANRGRWIHVGFHARVASAANNDGVVQIYVDGALVTGYTNLKSYPGAGAPNTFTTGYFLGFANNTFQAGQYTYITNIKVSTGGFAS